MYRRPNDSCTTDYLSSSSERRGNVKHRLEMCFSLYIGNQNLDCNVSLPEFR